MASHSESHAIGILGGSFNPVHNGHVLLARAIQDFFHFQPLYIVPTSSPPHKEEYKVSSEHRLEMVKLAFNGCTSTEISKFELESEGPSYAIRTIEYFRRKHLSSQIHFILGTDAFYDLPKWYAFPDVMEACSYIVVDRAGWDDEDAEEDPEHSKLSARLKQLIKANLLINLEHRPGEPVERILKTRSGTKVFIFKAKLPAISSTEVRTRLQLGVSIHGLVPDSVEAYLKSTALYGTQKP